MSECLAQGFTPCSLYQFPWSDPLIITLCQFIVWQVLPVHFHRQPVRTAISVPPVTFADINYALIIRASISLSRPKKSILSCTVLLVICISGMVSESTSDHTQRELCFPAIDDLWQKNLDDVHKRLEEKEKLVLAGKQFQQIYKA